MSQQNSPPAGGASAPPPGSPTDQVRLNGLRRILKLEGYPEADAIQSADEAEMVLKHLQGRGARNSAPTQSPQAPPPTPTFSRPPTANAPPAGGPLLGIPGGQPAAAETPEVGSSGAHALSSRRNQGIVTPANQDEYLPPRIIYAFAESDDEYPDGRVI